MNATGWLSTLAVLLAIGAGAFFWVRGEGEAPGLVAPEELLVGRAGAQLELAAQDWDSGLRSLRVVVQHAAGEEVLVDETYPGNLLSGGVRYEHAVELALEAEALAELEGPTLLVVAVRDWSLRGNETRVELPLTVDVEAPRISVHSGLTYVRQGGSGSVAYRLSEKTARDGVRVGEREYRGYPQPGGVDGERIALFAVPADGDPEAPVRVYAVDAAGNASEAQWSLVVKPHPQPVGQVRLSASFLQNVLPRLADDAASDPHGAFDRVNTKLREENERRIRELIAESVPEPIFRGRLHQLASSKVTSRFGERRTYLVDGQAVSKATHYGYDLASFAAAPITAAAAGRVLFADELGIYGNCVLLDHGLGLSTLYGHLSRIDVKAGQRVDRDARLGLSGATGLAGGDHLHFAVLVGDTYVDPLEWWDAKWVATHVENNLRTPAR